MAVLTDVPPRPADYTLGTPLVDSRGRRYRYLRFSVTDRCDMRCIYCMPPGGEEEHSLRKEVLSFEEVGRIVRVFAAGGIRRVRFTGGEPLVRKDIVRLVELVERTTDVESLVMTTNASRLAELARPLREAGLSGVNVSLDSLDPERFARLTRGGDLGRVLAGIHAARDVGLEVKINTVLLRGETDDEAGALVDWAWAHGLTPRFIELMPLGEGALLGDEYRVTAEEVIARLGDRVDGTEPADDEGPTGPARYLRRRRGGGQRVGFITPLSSTFCDTCNRVRITSRGDLRPCLASRRAVQLRDRLRGGASDDELAWAIQWGLTRKAKGHAFLEPEEDEHTRVGMSLIGG